MRNKKLFVFALAVYFLVGCSQYPENNLADSRELYASTLKSLTRLKAAGLLSDSVIAHVDILVDEITDGFEEWEDAINLGNPRPDLHDVIQKALITLAKLKSIGEE